MSKTVKLSIILFFDGYEKDIKKCLESLIDQTYKEFEVLCCMLHAPTDQIKVVNNFCARDDRIKKVVEKVAGRRFLEVVKDCIDECSGSHVILLNYYDYLSVDYCRVLMEKITDTAADIIVSKTIYCNNTGERYYYNLDPFYVTEIELHDKEIVSNFIKYSNYCASWRILGNKLLAKGIITKALITMADMNIELQNWEHSKLILLFFVMLYAKKINSVHNVIYFANDIHIGPCGYINKTDIFNAMSAIKNDIQEICIFNKTIIEIFEAFLNEQIKKEMLSNEINIFTEILLKQYIKVVNELGINKKFNKLLQKYLNCKMSDINNHEPYFEMIRTSLDQVFDDYEKLKRAIAHEKTQYVSFDIFDTLILRNLFEPSDLFSFLDKPFNELMNTSGYISFKKIRQLGEISCRKTIFALKPHFEEITLDEIYIQIEKDYHFPKVVLDKIKQIEIALELKYCIERKTGKDLYKLAQYCGKKIICISDMYLPLEVIEKILSKNNYLSFFKIYVSSHIKLGKYTGKLYQYVKKDLKITKLEEVLHIGDNWVVDVETAKINKFQAFHLSKPTDLFKNMNPGIFTGNYYKKIFSPNGSTIDGRCAIDFFLGIRSMAAIVSNKIFDNPFFSFNSNTDFNVNPYFVGYFVVGMHIYGLITWLINSVKSNNYSKLHFLSRDGYLLYEAYKIISEDLEDVIPAEYTYMSRYMIVLSDILTKVDVLSIDNKMNVCAASPKKIFEIFKPALSLDTHINPIDMCYEEGFLYEKPFGNYDAFRKFIIFFSEKCIDYNKLTIYRKNVKRYFTKIFHPNECFFDVGYNGRVETALETICGFPVDSYYLHIYKPIALERQQQKSFKIHTFYDYMPVSTFLIREEIISKLAPSVKGFQFDNNRTELVFKENQKNCFTEFLLGTIQNAALDFVKDYRKVYKGVHDILYFRNHDASLPFEFFVHKSLYIDRAMFKCESFEDEFGDNTVFNLCDYWEQNLNLFHICCSNNSCQSASDIYEYGLFMKFYGLINKVMPKGSQRREITKKLVSFFLKK